jgi:hypothetical protein
VVFCEESSNFGLLFSCDVGLISIQISSLAKHILFSTFANSCESTMHGYPNQGSGCHVGRHGYPNQGTIQPGVSLPCGSTMHGYPNQGSASHVVQPGVGLPYGSTMHGYPNQGRPGPSMWANHAWVPQPGVGLPCGSTMHGSASHVGQPCMGVSLPCGSTMHGYPNQGSASMWVGMGKPGVKKNLKKK